MITYITNNKVGAREYGSEQAKRLTEARQIRTDKGAESCGSRFGCVWGPAGGEPEATWTCTRTVMIEAPFLADAFRSFVVVSLVALGNSISLLAFPLIDSAATRMTFEPRA